MKTESRLRGIIPFAVGLLLLGGFVACNDDDGGGTGPGDTTVPASLVGTWTATSVTVDGTDTPLADFFEWEPTTVEMIAVFTADGRISSEEHDAGGNVMYFDSGPCTIAGNHMTARVDSEQGNPVTPYVTFDGTWVVSGNQLTLSMTDPDSESLVVLVWTKG